MLKTRQTDVRHISRLITYSSLLILTVFFVSLIFFILSAANQKPVVINEVCSNNFNLLKDDTGLYSDYIELYNAGNETISLEGCFLSDDENQLYKYPLETISIPPMGYHVIWLTKKTDVIIPENTNVTRDTNSEFDISKYGEKIYLSDSNSGEILDEVEIPELLYNTCYGRIEDGGSEWAKMSGTAGRTNTDSKILPNASLTAPVFNVESGFYKDSFEVEITASEDDTIYYTLDGSIPTCDSYIYQTPIMIDDISQRENIYASRDDLSPTRQYIPSFPVDKATVLRAVSYNAEDNAISNVVTKVYFIGYDNRIEYDNLPVVSIATDSNNLFGAETGIYGNGIALEQYKEAGGLQNGKLLDSFTDQEGNEHALYMASNAFNKGREWEREVSLTYFNNLHDFCFEQNVGIRIAGQSTRSRQQKSLSIFGREIYGNNALLPYEFFPGTSYSTIKLRNGGNKNGMVMITDAFLEELAEGRNVSIQRATPCVLFINGEYWGIYNIRERYKEEYLSNHYDVNENNVWIINRGIVEAGGNEAWDAYQFMIYMINECDLSYDDVYDMICDIIDVQSLIDYWCINLYTGNKDVSFTKNTALWRTIETEEGTYGDGKWRWMHYDMDLSLSGDDDVSWMKNHPLMDEPVITSMFANDRFKKQFCLTFMDIANTNYSYDLVHEKLMEWEDIYRKQVVKTNQRFVEENFNEVTFHGYIEEIDNFFRDRLPFAMESLAYTFGLTGEIETITIENHSPEGGTVIVNTAQLDGLEEWSGQYFTDYPITLTAVPKEGYHFAGWLGDINREEDTVEIELPGGGLKLEAVFEKSN